MLGRAGADVPYAAIHVRDGDGDLALAAATPGGDGHADGWPLEEVLADGTPRTVADLTDDVRRAAVGRLVRPARRSDGAAAARRARRPRPPA